MLTGENSDVHTDIRTCSTQDTMAEDPLDESVPPSHVTKKKPRKLNLSIQIESSDHSKEAKDPSTREHTNGTDSNSDVYPGSLQCLVVAGKDSKTRSSESSTQETPTVSARGDPSPGRMGTMHLSDDPQTNSSLTNARNYEQRPFSQHTTSSLCSPIDKLSLNSERNARTRTTREKTLSPTPSFALRFVHKILGFCCACWSVPTPSPPNGTHDVLFSSHKDIDNALDEVLNGSKNSFGTQNQIIAAVAAASNSNLIRIRSRSAQSKQIGRGTSASVSTAHFTPVFSPSAGIRSFHDTNQTTSSPSTHASPRFVSHPRSVPSSTEHISLLLGNISQSNQATPVSLISTPSFTSHSVRDSFLRRVTSHRNVKLSSTDADSRMQSVPSTRSNSESASSPLQSIRTGPPESLQLAGTFKEPHRSTDTDAESHELVTSSKGMGEASPTSRRGILKTISSGNEPNIDKLQPKTECPDSLKVLHSQKSSFSGNKQSTCERIRSPTSEGGSQNADVMTDCAFIKPCPHSETEESANAAIHNVPGAVEEATLRCVRPNGSESCARLNASVYSPCATPSETDFGKRPLTIDDGNKSKHQLKSRPGSTVTFAPRPEIWERED